MEYLAEKFDMEGVTEDDLKTMFQRRRSEQAASKCRGVSFCFGCVCLIVAFVCCLIDPSCQPLNIKRVVNFAFATLVCRRSVLKQQLKRMNDL